MDIFGFLFDTSKWPARWHCGEWTSALGWTHIISDIAIFLAYFCIPAVLLYWCIKRRDIPFNYLLVLFALFIVFCGSGHLVEAMIFWKPFYRFDGLIKLATAIIPWVTVVALLPVIPKVLEFPKMERLNQILNRDLKDSKKRLELSFQGADAGLWEWDILKNQINFSTFFFQMFGQESDFPQKSFEEFVQHIHPSDQAVFKDGIRKHLEHKEPFQCKFRMQVKGAYRWFHVRGLAQFDEQDQAVRMAGSITDIQDAIDTQLKLSQTVTELQSANKEMEDFLYVVSHDMRAPLINIKGFSEELGRSFQELDPHLEKIADEKSLIACKEEVPQALKFISGSVQKIDHLIEALLKLSRLGKSVFTFEKINTKSVVEDQVLALSHQIKQGNIQVEVHDLPEVVADRVAVQQIFGNLLDNAIKYSDPARPNKIEISAETFSDHTRFSIKDKGLGIKEKDFPKVFEIFKRIDSVATKGEGMGLAYIRTLVKRLNGVLDFTSIHGEGSIFFFTIPHNVKAEEGADVIA